MKLLAPKQLLIETCAGLIILLFVYTAFMKFRDLGVFIGAMEHSAPIRQYAYLLAGLIPTLEIGASILLFIPQLRIAGFWMALILMILFTGYVGLILASSEQLPCTCGGVIQRMKWPEHLAFNIIFLAISLIGLLLERNRIAIHRSSRIPVNIVGNISSI